MSISPRQPKSHPASPPKGDTLRRGVATVSLDALLPRWTSYIASDSGGRDPLGLSRVSGRITDFLLTGIITTTDRARYYSFLCWALWHIEQEEAPTSRAFLDGLRRREAAFALATFCNDNEAGFIGNRMTKVQQIDPPTQSFSCDFRVLPSNQLGGYGQYYNRCLQKLGLVIFNDSRVDTAAPGFAEQLARSVQRTIEKTPYIKNRVFAGKSFPKADLERSCQRLGLDALSLPETATERRLLIDLFFGWADIPMAQTEAKRETMLRRQSLTQMLHVAASYQQAGLDIHLDTLDWQFLYGPVYFGALVGADKHVPYDAPESLSVCRGFWKQFCLHQYFTRACELLLWSVLQSVAARAEGLMLSEVVADCTSVEFLGFLREATGSDCRSPRALLEAVGSQEPDFPSCALLRQHINSEHPLNEEDISSDNSLSPAECVAQACLLLAVLYGKWRRVDTDLEPEWREVAAIAEQESWAGTFLPRLDAWSHAEATWEQCLTRLLQQVVSRHKQVRLSRNRGIDGAWLQENGERLVKGRDFDPTWRSSRHSNVCKILCDLHLLARDPDGFISLTSEGEVVLAKALEEDTQGGGEA